MVERTPVLNAVTQMVLLFGLLVALVPLWLVFVASTLTLQEINTPPISLVPGRHFIENLSEAWRRADLGLKMINSLIMALSVAVGKVGLAACSAFAIVFFRFPGRTLAFWLIFITLMLPLEIRIVPTYAVAANVMTPFATILDMTGFSWLWQQLTGSQLILEVNLLNTYSGLVLPLVATATGTFLYRQFFMTIPDHLVEAARMDGAGPVRFFFQILLPLSKTNMAALFTIMFITAWNQYLWPLLVITDREGFGTAVMALRQLTPPVGDSTGGETPDWNVVMAACLVVIAPALVVIITMQRFFVRGLTATDK